MRQLQEQHMLEMGADARSAILPAFAHLDFHKVDCIICQLSTGQP
jgi:hypothetical protein